MKITGPAQSLIPPRKVAKVLIVIGIVLFILGWLYKNWSAYEVAGAEHQQGSHGRQRPTDELSVDEMITQIAQGKWILVAEFDGLKEDYSKPVPWTDFGLKVVWSAPYKAITENKAGKMVREIKNNTDSNSPGLVFSGISAVDDYRVKFAAATDTPTHILVVKPDLKKMAEENP